MATMLACCALDAACGVATKTLSCCCCSLPWGRSNAAKFSNGILFVLVSFLAFAVDQWSNGLLHYPAITDVVCDQMCYRLYTIYKIMFGLAMYHALQAAVLLGVEDTSDPRAIIQTGFWPVKLCLLLGSIVGAFFLKHSFYDMLYYVSLGCSALFMLIQAILLVDFAYRWVIELLTAYEETGREIYKYALIGLTTLFNTAILVSTGYLFYHYDGSLSRSLISLNFIFYLFMNICSVLETVQESNPQAGIFQSSFLSCYNMCLVASAFLTKPLSNPNAAVPNVSTNWATSITVMCYVFALISIAYSVHKASRSTNLLSNKSGDEEDGVTKVGDDGEAVDEYNFTLFHAIFVLAALYVSLVMTQWKFPEVVNGAVALVDTNTTFWVKIGVSWAVCSLYMWSLFAPLVFTDRDFSF